MAEQEGRTCCSLCIEEGWSVGSSPTLSEVGSWLMTCAAATVSTVELFSQVPEGILLLSVPPYFLRYTHFPNMKSKAVTAGNTKKVFDNWRTEE